jgi:hypothetical protein
VIDNHGTGPHPPQRVTAVAVAHSLRFREVATGYPHAVALAYGRDLAAAAADSDEQVAARVAAWEIAEGIEPRDWHELGAEQRKDDYMTDDLTLSPLWFPAPPAGVEPARLERLVQVAELALDEAETITLGAFGARWELVPDVVLIEEASNDERRPPPSSTVLLRGGRRQVHLYVDSR